MSEEEFCFWRDERAEYDRLIKQAVDDQIAEARKKQDSHEPPQS